MCLPDGGNLSVPLTDDEKPVYTKPWPHADQSVLKPEFACVQGLLNILPNGPDDGGLVVMTNSVNKFSEVFEAFDHQKVSKETLCHLSRSIEART